MALVCVINIALNFFLVFHTSLSFRLGREDALFRQEETLMGDVQQVGRLVRAAVPGRLDGVPRRERIARQEGEVLVTAGARGRRVGHRVRRLRLLVVRRSQGDAQPPLRLGRAAPEPGGGDRDQPSPTSTNLGVTSDVSSLSGPVTRRRAAVA